MSLLISLHVRYNLFSRTILDHPKSRQFVTRQMQSIYIAYSPILLLLYSETILSDSDQCYTILY